MFHANVNSVYVVYICVFRANAGLYVRPSENILTFLQMSVSRENSNNFKEKILSLISKHLVIQKIIATPHRFIGP